MSKPLLERLRRLELELDTRGKARECRHPERLWIALNLVVRAMAGEDVASWQAASAALPRLPTDPNRAPLGHVERNLRVLSLLAREAREKPAYRELLGVAVKAGLVEQRQERWMRAAGLVETTGR